MAGTGPAPNPNSRKQTGTAAHTWTDLPAGGFGGDVPAWPFPSCSDRELEVWESIWRTPQAHAWSLLGWTREVAMYVMVSVFAEAGAFPAIQESRLRSVDLGLTPQGMLKNRWRVRADEVAEKRDAKTAPGQSARRRLKVADDAVAEA